MEMSYLGIYEWVYEKVLSNIVTPVFDFVVSIINIAWGYVFQYILGPILLPVLQVVFYWVIRVVEVLGAFMNYMQFIGYLVVVDCLEKAFDIFIGLEPVTYYPNGRGGVAVTGSLLEVLFTSTAISEAFKVITLGGVGVALLLTIFGVAKSSFDLDFENKRPVSHVMKQLFKSVLGAFLIPFAVWFMIQLSMIILTTLNTAVSFNDDGGRSTLGSTIFTIASVNAAWDSDSNMSSWGTVALDEGFGFKVLDKANPDFDITKEPRRNFYLNDTYERYTNIPNVLLYFDLSRFDYLMGGWTAIFLCVILFLCFLTVIRRIFEILLLYLVSPYFVAMMPLDDGEKFKQWFGMFMGKLFTGYGTVVLMKIYLMLMPLILRGGITAEGMGGESRIVMAALYVMGGAWTVYKSGSLLTGLVNEAAGRMEQESNRDAYGAAMLAAAPFRAIKNRLEQKVSGKLEEKITGAGRNVGSLIPGGVSKGSGARSEARASRLQSKPHSQYNKDNLFARNAGGTIDLRSATERKSAVFAKRDEIAKVREKALSYSDPKERSQYVTNWLQQRAEDKGSSMYFKPADRMRLERTFGCTIDKAPIPSGVNKGQTCFHPKNPKPSDGTRLNPDNSEGDNK